MKTVFVQRKFTTWAEIKQGLMDDFDPLQPACAALFVLHVEKRIAMWMKNTPRALDMIFVRKDMTVADIHKGALPFDETRIVPSEPIKYVLETLAGYIDTYQIQKGDQLVFVDV
jgi:uncharacterized membrane protein (UPF0127 family)